MKSFNADDFVLLGGVALGVIGVVISLFLFAKAMQFFPPPAGESPATALITTTGVLVLSSLAWLIYFAVKYRKSNPID